MNTVHRFPTKIKTTSQAETPRALPPAPYPSDTEAGRFSVQLPHAEIESSRGWLLAPADVKPLILMLFYNAWKLMPTAALPDDDELIAAIVGIDAKHFQAIRRFLLDGWVCHEDGRLYHPVLVRQVEKMLEGRAGGAERQRTWREKQKRLKQPQPDAHGAEPPAARQAPDAAPVQDDASQAHGDDGDAPRSTRTRTRRTRTGAADGEDGTDTPPPKPISRQHSEIIDIYHEVVPELPRVVKSRWAGSARERELSKRIRENEAHSNPLFWRAFFTAVRTNPHWMGLSRPRDGVVPWRADLGWLLKREKFDRVIEMLPQEGDETASVQEGRS